jgi:hypothetical protein
VIWRHSVLHDFASAPNAFRCQRFCLVARLFDCALRETGRTSRLESATSQFFFVGGRWWILCEERDERGEQKNPLAFFCTKPPRSVYCPGRPGTSCHILKCQRRRRSPGDANRLGNLGTPLHAGASVRGHRDGGGWCIVTGRRVGAWPDILADHRFLYLQRRHSAGDEMGVRAQTTKPDR